MVGVVAALVIGLLLGAIIAYVVASNQAQATSQQRLMVELDKLRDETIEKTRSRVEQRLREDLTGEVKHALEVKHEDEIKQEVRRRAEADAARLVEEGKLKREAAIKQGELDAKELTLKAQREAEAELKERRANLEKVEERLDKREAGLDARAEKLDEREAQAKARDAKATRDEEALAKRVVQLDEREATIQRELERIAAMTGDEARKLVMDQIVGQASIDAAKRARQVEEEAMEEADRRAKRVISIAVQRWAGEYAAEKSVSVVSLPSDEMKGRIIGREGRNIRALEAATGVDVIIDDTPEAVIISGFDPVRREIARLTLEKLISDGRIHPSRIEEVVVKTEQEVAQIIKEAGERAAFELGIHGLHPELLKLLGRLKYRTSYGQNMWSHSIEVGFLCGLMAAELGVNVKAARRAGLLHDIGKAVTHEQEGSHAIIGADFCKKYGETELVRNAVAAHHNEEPQNSVIAHLVIAADSLSGARPGARREILETYIKRLEDLERISMGFEGVEKSYAIQAGREIRVLVQNSRVTDDQAFMLSRDIAKKIEDELTYPGQIKVTVIRETRAVEYAR
jgi:ribonuclease Y